MFLLEKISLKIFFSFNKILSEKNFFEKENYWKIFLIRINICQKKEFCQKKNVMHFVADVVSDKSMLANQCLLHKNFVGWGGISVRGKIVRKRISLKKIFDRKKNCWKKFCWEKIFPNKICWGKIFCWEKNCLEKKILSEKKFVATKILKKVSLKRKFIGKKFLSEKKLSEKNVMDSVADFVLDKSMLIFTLLHTAVVFHATI